MATATDKKHSTDELSSLFDAIDIDSNLDEESESSEMRSFTDVCEDVKSVMDHEEVTAEPEPEQTEPEPEIEPAIETEPETAPVEAKPAPAPAPEPVAQVQTQKNDNPLGLAGENLNAYSQITKRFPQFQLYDGSQAFRSYYGFKVRVLKGLLTSFPLLNISDMTKETNTINMKHQVDGNSIPDPRVIGLKMGECQMCRERVTSLLMKALAQLPAWKKFTEILNSKVWKDHDMKGAHKREALAGEHNLDMMQYYTALQGFVDSASSLDNYLKATHDSLSRQLSCVITTDKAGMQEFSEHEAPPAPPVVETKPHVAVASPAVEKQAFSSSEDSSLDELDTIESGIFIPKVRKGGLSERDFAGADDDSDFLESVG